MRWEVYVPPFNAPSENPRTLQGKEQKDKQQLHNTTCFLSLMVQFQNRGGGVKAAQIGSSIDPNWTGFCCFHSLVFCFVLLPSCHAQLFKRIIFLFLFSTSSSQYICRGLQNELRKHLAINNDGKVSWRFFLATYDYRQFLVIV